MAWPRSDYAAAAATANPTASATLFSPADLEALTYETPTPSSVLAPATTGAHRGLAMPLAITMALANAPDLAAPSSFQPRQLEPARDAPLQPTSAYAHATPVIVEYARPEPLLRK